MPNKSVDFVFTVIGVGPPHTQVTLWIDSVTSFCAKIDADGNFKAEVPRPIAEGRHVLFACAENASCRSNKVAVSFVVGNEFPLVPPVILLPFNRAIISDPTPTVEGTALPGSTVTVCLEGVGCESVPVGANGTFSVTYLEDLPDGVYRVTAVQTTPEGRTSGQATVIFTIDSLDLLFQPTGIIMGEDFRTIKVVLNASSSIPTLQVHYLLLAPGVITPTEEEVIASGTPAFAANNQVALSNGTMARGQFSLTVTEDVQSFEENITGLTFALQLPSETGVIDGNRYDVYLVAVASPDITSGVTTLSPSAIGMPFGGGNGTVLSPYTLRQLTPGDLVLYPDLASSSPLNLMGVDQTARMLDNIERMQELYDQTGGQNGMIDSLTFAYELTTPFNLLPYRFAYNGKGWRPIGNYDSTRFGVPLSGTHIFTGSLLGYNLNTLISGLRINKSALLGDFVLLAGLFGFAQDATFGDLAITDADIKVVASDWVNSFEYACIGALAGRMERCTVTQISMDTLHLEGSMQTGNSNPLYMGGLVGFITEESSFTDIDGTGINVLNRARKASNIGGLAGGVEAFYGSILLRDISLESIVMEGFSRAGGGIGYIACMQATMENIQINTIAMTVDGSEIGGWAGRLESSGICNISNIDIAGFVINSQATRISSYVGGMVGAAFMNQNCTISACSVSLGSLFASGYAGGMFGLYQAEAGIHNLVDCDADATISASTDNVGGFIGALISRNTAQTTLLRCDVSSSATLSARDMLGGFMGSLNEAITASIPTITDCFTNASVDSTIQYGTGVGGFVGRSYKATYTRCSARGNVIGHQYVGGFMGRGIATAQAGNVGHDLVVSFCDFTSLITADGTYIGGVVGFADNILITDCDTVFTFTAGTSYNVGGIMGGVYEKALIERCTSNVDITCGPGVNNIGGILGNSTDYSLATINDCTTEGVISNGNCVGGIQGGILGRSVVKIANCSSSVQIQSVEDKIGGILGAGYDLPTARSAITMTGCFSAGVSIGSAKVGGIIGDAAYNTKIENCYAIGTVEAINGPAGGIAGTAKNNTLIQSCFSECFVVSTLEAAGGIVGLLQSDNVNEKANVLNCYSIESIDGYYAGGIIGNAFEYVNVAQCYATGTITCTDASGNAAGIVGKVSANVTVHNTYALNDEIIAPIGSVASNFGLIHGTLATSTLNNYAWDGIVTTNFTPTPLGINTKNGLAVTSALVEKPSTHYVTNGLWNFTTIWAYSANPAVDLPIVRSVPEANQAPTL